MIRMNVCIYKALIPVTKSTVKEATAEQTNSSIKSYSKKLLLYTFLELKATVRKLLLS